MNQINQIIITHTKNKIGLMVFFRQFYPKCGLKVAKEFAENLPHTLGYLGDDDKLLSEERWFTDQDMFEINNQLKDVADVFVASKPRDYESNEDFLARQKFEYAQNWYSKLNDHDKEMVDILKRSCMPVG